MQNFNLIQNDLIKTIDQKSIDSTPKVDPLSNTLKTIKKVLPGQTLNGNPIYNKRFLFDIPREYDNLAQVYIKCTLTTGLLTNSESYLGAKIFKEIYLKTKNGVVLQKITPKYTSARLDELNNTPLENILNASIEPDTDFTTPATLFVPCFLFFSENVNSFLKTRSLEKLEIEVCTNVNKESMGMDQDLTAASYELFLQYHDVNTSSRITDELWTIKNIPKMFYGSFNIFEEDLVEIPTSATSAKLLLRCPYPVFAVHVAIVDASTNRKQVKTFKITTANDDLVDIDYRINYQLYSDKQSFLPSGTTSYFLSKTKDRSVDSGMIVFSKEMFPSYLEVTFNASAGYTLYVLCEYRTNFTISDKGVVNVNFSSDGSLMDQQNSFNEAFLTG